MAGFFGGGGCQQCSWTKVSLYKERQQIGDKLNLSIFLALRGRDFVSSKIVTLHDQCDPIWRNFATLAK